MFVWRPGGCVLFFRNRQMLGSQYRSRTAHCWILNRKSKEYPNKGQGLVHTLGKRNWGVARIGVAVAQLGIAGEKRCQRGTDMLFHHIQCGVRTFASRLYYAAQKITKTVIQGLVGIGLIAPTA